MPAFSIPPSSSRSMQLWGLDWRELLPWRFADVTLEAGVFEQAEPFVRAHYAAIFGGDGQASRFLADPMTPAKRRFAEEMDSLLFRHGGRTIGLLIGHPSDWSTYYFRSVAILPAYRERRLLTEAVERSLDVLRNAGVERAEGDCSPANLPMMRMLTRLGFVVTSTSNSERWGAAVRFTKFLLPEAEEVFVRQFCAMRTKSSAAAP